MDTDVRDTWFKLSVEDQISNIGSEVNRAIKWKNKGNIKRCAGFCKKAVEFLTLTKEDPKNCRRGQEFDFCIEELEDYFLGENMYGTTDEMLSKYYDAFLRNNV